MSPNSPANKESAQAGARHFRRLLQCLSVAYFVLLAVVCIHQYSRYAAVAVAAQGTGIYRGMQEWATLTYYAFWLAISFLALSAFWRRMVWLSFYACLALLAETAAYVFFFASHLHLYSPVPEILYGRFEPHPFVVALPRRVSSGRRPMIRSIEERPSTKGRW